MKAGFEIEAKFRLTPEQAEALKRSLSPVAAHEQVDRYFDVPEKVLRIRCEDGNFLLTQKDPTQISPEGIKTRFEKEGPLTPQEAERLSELLPWCGHEERTTVRKHRTVYTSHGAEVCLDEIQGLPHPFLEVEGGDTKGAIAWLQEAIGLKPEQVELSSYAKLVAEQQGNREAE